jgi:hypothetical protein
VNTSISQSAITTYFITLARKIDYSIHYHVPLLALVDLQILPHAVLLLLDD